MEDRLLGLQNQEKSRGTNRIRFLLLILSLVAIAGVGIGFSSVVHDIDELRSQLKALQQNTPASSATVGKLEASITSINQFLGADSVVTSLQCLDDTTKLAYASNGMAIASCPTNCDASVSTSHLWGTHIYSASSSICLAAVHDGELQLSAGGVIRVVQQPGQNRYIGSTQHGVTSSDKDASTSSFSIGTTLRQNVSDVVDSMKGELKMFFSSTCPPGWTESEITQGYLLTGRPVGAMTGSTNGARALTKDEKGRVSAHTHGINDPGHTHGYVAFPEGPSGWAYGWSPDYHFGSSQLTTDNAITGLSIQDNEGEDLPLLFVLICQKL